MQSLVGFSNMDTAKRSADQLLAGPIRVTLPRGLRASMKGVFWDELALWELSQ